MKKNNVKKCYYFVDESGDPYFYDRFGNYIVDKEGCSKILILGFIKTQNPTSIRSALKKVHLTIAKEKYLNGIPSLKKSLVTFHAKDDCPEVREKVFKAINKLNFKAEFYIARKLESIFIKRHKKNPDIFYDDLISKLFKNQLHLAEENLIYLAVRGNRARQKPIEEAITKAKLLFEKKWQTKVNSQINIFPQTTIGEPCLQVVDYMAWAVQRAFIKKDMRFVNFVKSKISLIADLYDFKNYPKNFYNKKNTFNYQKISPL
ncbi:DUF3800 domain-containing protein [Patescibacteria group bacterium]|nr:DUF3800 domain-containing protein [Patescibacteria group bacterium]MCG2702321.1 DUF3800 domain-containing protein [Candidatus Parcubacteria bacterium]MBU4264989.1 DUF3800 domain-containing protein [Patescibacteria group bacterium]MBU4389826.1 DUF3800 domain-containing protein [Patescibacteria group bacterium]MBU4431387.1 DUF3800 domain-containing protein [Patescibacteria group bacterium]